MTRYFTIVIFFLSVNASAQNRLQKNLQKADFYKDANHFGKATVYYKNAIRIDPENRYAILLLAHCYKKLNEFSNALKIYDYAFHKGFLDDSLLTNYVYCAKKTGNLKLTEDIIKKTVNTSLKESLKTEIDSIKKWRERPSRIIIKNIKAANTSFSEISPKTHPENGLMFLSNQEGMIIKKRSGATKMPNYNIYFSNYVKPGSTNFKKGKLISSTINSKMQEGGFCFSKDLKKIYYSRAYEEFDGSYRFKLYLSEKQKRGWGQLKTFAFNDSTASFTHPFISNDEQLFFFSSDMAGGFGGKDLYVCVKIDSLWSDPINLGPKINTKGNEIFPYLSHSQNLYFSSDGHISLGGYDIYKVMQIDGEWGDVINMKPPLNSNHDEFSIYFINNSEIEGYFSSNRPDGKGLEDLYYFKFK